MWAVDPRVHTAIGYSHSVRFRLEVWRGTEQLSADAPYISGAVDATWVTGITRTLNLTVPPTPAWQEWLQIGVELRLFRGVNFGGPGSDELCPLGRFPLEAFSRSLTTKEVATVTASDRWAGVVADTFAYPVASYSGSAAHVAGRLLTEVDYGNPAIVTATSQADTPSGLWDKSRHDTIVELLKPIGAEGFMDRLGRPIVRDRPTVGAPVATLRTGPGGTAISLKETTDWSKVWNAVGVASSATGVVIDPVFVAITDPTDPASRERISGGTTGGGWHVKRYASPLFTNRDQMIAAGYTLLHQGAGPARQWTITSVPDPSLDVGDTVLVETAPGGPLEAAQISTITYPLVVTDSQAITTVSTREDDSFG